jgi:hypothetical protein
MTITLYLKPELEARLLVKAQSNGVEVDEYVLSLLEGAVRPPQSNPAANSRQEAVQRMVEFGDEQRLSSGAPITRRSLHEDHRF